jgi:carboxyl-terminal processing protease
LIQRPYEGVSLYDYYSHAADSNSPAANREVKMTDSGRTVYGGGGITPDVVLPEPKQNDFQDNLYSPDYPDRNVFLDFTDYYLGKHDNVSRNWAPDEETIQQFKQFLSEQNIPYTEEQIRSNEDWIKLHVRVQMITSLYGSNEGNRVKYMADPEVERAVELLPEAQALNQHAKQIIATRQNSRPLAQQ